MSGITIEEMRRKWKQSAQEQAQRRVAKLAAEGLTPAQIEARLNLDYKPETLAERNERESEERIAEMAVMRAERTKERRRIAYEELGESHAYLLQRVIELEIQRDYAIELAAKYKGFATALLEQVLRRNKELQEREL